MGRQRMWVNLVTEVCGHCCASISLANYRRHVAACKKRTPDQRKNWLSANWQRKRRDGA